MGTRSFTLRECFLVGPEGRPAAICRGPLERTRLDVVIEAPLATGEPSLAAVIRPYRPV